MEKQEILNHLLEKALEITAYLEEHCDYEQLYEDGLYAMLYIRYQTLFPCCGRTAPAMAACGQACNFNQCKSCLCRIRK